MRPYLFNSKGVIMKKYNLVIVIIFYLFTTILQAQKYPKGIFNIVWRDSQEKVNKIMHTKKNVEFYNYQEKDQLVFNNVEVSGRKCFLKYIFYKNQLCEIEMLFTINRDEFAGAYSEALRTLLVKYDPPTENVFDKSKGIAQAIWRITANDNKKYCIVLSANYENGGFNIFYTYMDLYNLKANDREKFNSKDF